MSNVIRIFEYTLHINRMHESAYYIIEGDKPKIQAEEASLEYYSWALTNKYVCAEVTLGKHQKVVKDLNAPWCFSTGGFEDGYQYTPREIYIDAEYSFNRSIPSELCEFNVKLFRKDKLAFY